MANNSQELRAAAPRQKTGDAGAASRYTLGARSTPPESGIGQPGPAARASEDHASAANAAAAPVARLQSSLQFLGRSMALDITLIVIMLISAFLAMVRGFMREVLSLAGWAAAAGAAVFAYLRLTGPALQFFNGANEIVVKAATVFTVAVVALIIVTVITTRISDKILDSKIGALDRTLGVLFGLGRGLIIVAVAFAFYHWWAPNDPYTRNAKSQGALIATADWLERLMPDNLDVYISDMLNSFKKRQKPQDEDAPDAPPPNQRSDRGSHGLMVAQTEPRIMAL